MNRFAINLALAGLAISLLGWILSLLLRKRATEWRLLAVQVAFALLLISPLLIAFEAGSRTGVAAIKVDVSLPTPPIQKAPPAFYQTAQTIHQSDVPGQVFGPAEPLIPSSPVETPSRLPAVLIGLWAVFIVGALGRLFFRSLALRLWLRRYATRTEGRTYTADVPAPFCGGVFRPFLVLPRDFETIPLQEQRAVLEHEEAHLRLVHPLQQFLAEIACAVFGWIPFTLALRAEMKDLHERQGDESVLRVQPDGLGLAQGLVRFAERLAEGHVPASALSIVRPGSRLEARVRRLVESKGIPMKPKKSLLALGAAILGLGSAALACTLQMTESPDGGDAARYMPFSEGAVWTYNILRPGNKPYEHKLYAWSLKNPDKEPVMEFRDVYGRDGRYLYWRATPAGLVPVDGMYLGDQPGFQMKPLRAPRLPSTLKEGYTWKWQEEFRGQTFSRRGDPPPKMPPTYYEAKVIAVDQPVTVPAGSYKAVVVETKSKSTGYEVKVRNYWVKDIGLAKSETYDKNGKLDHTEELMQFTPGTPIRQDADYLPAIQNAIGNDPALAKLGKADKMEMLANWELSQLYRSRFAAVSWKKRTVVFRIGEGKVTTVDPGSPESWHAFSAAEKSNVMSVAAGMALLTAASRGLPLEGASATSATTANATGLQITNVVTKGTRANGDPWSLTIQFKSKAGKVLSIHG